MFMLSWVFDLRRDSKKKKKLFKPSITPLGSLPALKSLFKRLKAAVVEGNVLCLMVYAFWFIL